MERSLISVVIPAFNEEKTIGSVISGTISSLEGLRLPFEVIVVDDGSTDSTRRIATQYKATVLANGRNRGKGYALKKGFQQAKGEVIVTIDADGSHRPAEIPALVRTLLKGVDAVSGSRFLGSGEHSTSRFNRFGNWLFCLLIMVLTGEHVTDTQTGLRAFRREVLTQLDLVSVGFEIEAEITVKALKNGFVWREQPITCEKRKYGASRLRIPSDGAKILKMILRASFAPMNHV